MSTCASFESSLFERAAGVLAAGKELELKEHLKTCASCARQYAELTSTLGLVALPAIGAKEQLTLASFPGRVLAAWRKRERRRYMAWGASFGIGVAAAAAVALAVLPSGARRISPGRVTVVERLEDPTLRALQEWGRGGLLAEGISEGNDDDDEEQGGEQ